MPQLFTPVSTSLFRAALVGVPALALLTITVMLALARSPYMTDQHNTPQQPVPFSHQHHVADIGIDCRYCHQTVEESANAGVPSTQVCMNCHRQLWNDTDMLAPVRESYRNDEPLQWNRVHDLPDYVYFNHSIHVKKGVGCYECHGPIGEMPLTQQHAPLTMKWCLDCHRNPEPHLRPQELVFDPRPLETIVDDQEIHAIQEKLFHEFDVKSRTDCYTCHR